MPAKQIKNMAGEEEALTLGDAYQRALLGIAQEKDGPHGHTRSMRRCGTHLAVKTAVNSSVRREIARQCRIDPSGKMPAC